MTHAAPIHTRSVVRFTGDAGSVPDGKKSLEVFNITVVNTVAALRSDDNVLQIFRQVNSLIAEIIAVCRYHHIVSRPPLPQVPAFGGIFPLEGCVGYALLDLQGINQLVRLPRVIPAYTHYPTAMLQKWPSGYYIPSSSLKFRRRVSS